MQQTGGINMKIYRSKETKELKNGFDYNPIIIETKNHKFEQNGKGHLFECATIGAVGAVLGCALLILVLCL